MNQIGLVAVQAVNPAKEVKVLKIKRRQKCSFFEPVWLLMSTPAHLPTLFTINIYPDVFARVEKCGHRFCEIKLRQYFYGFIMCACRNMIW